MSRIGGFTRRDFLRGVTGGIAALPFARLEALEKRPRFVEPKRVRYRGTDDDLLEEIERAAFDFFWTEAGPSGQVKDRAFLNGRDTHTLASIAATGFGLTGLCIGHARRYRNPEDITERVRQTLRFIWDKLPHEHGFYFHFLDITTGQRQWMSEVSSIDTSILLCGVLTARQYFKDSEIQDLATKIYERADWDWMLDGGRTLSMGWYPESGFISMRWAHYCELMMIYLLALGSPTHPISSRSWTAWRRPDLSYEGFEYISGNDPLFTHQYSQAWFDFRGRRDAYTNYFKNSITATMAHREFCLSLRNKLPDYSERLWGITASDSVTGYRIWGGPPSMGDPDGTIVPCASGGSLVFLYPECMEVLRNIRERYGRAWGNYGYVDAFNPLTDWYDNVVLGIDVGITMLMAENHRTKFVWNTFMKNQEARRGMAKAGFHSEEWWEEHAPPQSAVANANR
ncbi:MAG TPA: glucoamylase family protein [Candidatus Sulfotelmatobacter sp.]|nr:glucoamylase family protein [Candidatus Sulfotelmatobacter sp.]